MVHRGVAQAGIMMENIAKRQLERIDENIEALNDYLDITKFKFISGGGVRNRSIDDR